MSKSIIKYLIEQNRNDYKLNDGTPLDIRNSNDPNWNRYAKEELERQRKRDLENYQKEALEKYKEDPKAYEKERIKIDPKNRQAI